LRNFRQKLSLNLSNLIGIKSQVFVTRIFAWLFICFAVSGILYELWNSFNTGSWKIFALGEIWFKLDVSSLNSLQSGIQRHLFPWLWEPFITTILLCPSWLVFGVPGALLILFAGKGKKSQN